LLYIDTIKSISIRTTVIFIRIYALTYAVIAMGRITLVIDDDMEQELRMLAAKKYGLKRGSLGAALNEAVRMWINKTREELKEEGWL